MRCPRDERHEGIKIEKCTDNIRSPHYARASCQVCNAWIKWINEEEAERFFAGGPTVMGDQAEAAEEASADVQGTVTAVCSTEAVGEIRAIVRDEMAKILRRIERCAKRQQKNRSAGYWK